MRHRALQLCKGFPDGETACAKALRPEITRCLRCIEEPHVARAEPGRGKGWEMWSEREQRWILQAVAALAFSQSTETTVGL